MKKLLLLSLSFFLCTLMAAQEADFRLMSFNIERGDLSVKKGWGWNVRKPAALEMLALRHPQLLGVQECNSEQRDDILERFPSFRHIGASVNGERGEHAASGNYIFYDSSVMELLDDGMFWFAFQPDSAGIFTWIAKKPRNATWGRFRHKATGREILYINNHLQNGTDAVVNRAMSVMELLHMMRRLNPDGIPMLYSGDLNSKCVESYYAPLNQEMKEAALVCPVTDLGTTLSSYKTKESATGRIDHIFFSGALEGLSFAVDREDHAGLEYVSDHFPVYADFRFTSAAPEKGEYWYDLKASPEDFSIKAGTWNLFNPVEREERGAPSWAACKEGVAEVIASLGTDILALQEMSEPMVRDLNKLLKKKLGKQYRLWADFADPDASNLGREAVGLLYNAERFKVSRQRVSWITASPQFELPSRPWGDDYRILLSAVFTDKVTGKSFFVLSGRLARGEKPTQYEGNVIKKIEKELNKEELPCLLLADMNAPLKRNVWISLLNYWSDTYTLMYPFPADYFSTRIPKDGFYPGNTPGDWNSKYGVVGISRYVENRILVTEHTVHREIAGSDPVLSDHCPVTATLVFK